MRPWPLHAATVLHGATDLHSMNIAHGIIAHGMNILHGASIHRSPCPLDDFLNKILTKRIKHALEALHFKSILYDTEGLDLASQELRRRASPPTSQTLSNVRRQGSTAVEDMVGCAGSV